MTDPAREKILEALKTVADPELGRDIVSLGMVKEISADGGKVFIHLDVTSPAAAVREAIQRETRKKISAVAGVEEVTVQMTGGSVPRGAAFAAKQPVAGIAHVIAVASGKGGVGKTTVAVNLSVALAKRGHRVGLMDCDIYGPNVPLMLGIDPKQKPEVSDEEKMIPIAAHGIRMISMGVLVPPDQPMVWRGPMLHSAVTQFVQKVDWGELDFLIVDLPPGTGDVQLSLVQTVPLSGAIIVTTPQEVALMDVRKGIAMFKKTEVPILGVIENMTGEIFGKGGGEKTAERYQVPYLGEIPLDRRIREGGDAGNPTVAAWPDTAAAQAFMKAAGLVSEMMSRAAKS